MESLRAPCNLNALQEGARQKRAPYVGSAFRPTWHGPA